MDNRHSQPKFNILLRADENTTASQNSTLLRNHLYLYNNHYKLNKKYWEHIFSYGVKSALVKRSQTKAQQNLNRFLLKWGGENTQKQQKENSRTWKVQNIGKKHLMLYSVHSCLFYGIIYQYMFIFHCHTPNRNQREDTPPSVPKQ